MFKKVFCIMLSTLMLAICCKITVQTNATELSENSIQKETTKKVYSTATIEDDFEPDSVIVVINKESSAINKVHSKEKFKGVEIEEIRDLTRITGDIKSKNIDEENYQQILQIMLKEKTKKEVLKAIKAFEKLDEVEYVGPNYNLSIEMEDMDDDTCVTEGRLNAYKAVSLALNYSVVTGDFEGDGKDEILRLTPIAATSEDAYNKIALHVTSSNGTTTLWRKYSLYNGSKIQGRIVAGDFNGDGKDDVATMYDYDNNNPKIHVFKSNGETFDNWETWFAETGIFNPNSVTERFTAGDFNGDGKDDIAAMYDYADGSTKILVFISTGTSFNYWNSWYTESRPGYYVAEYVTGRFSAGDFNNDGKDDIATMYDYPSGATRIHVFKSNGTSFGNFKTWYAQNTAGYYNTEKVLNRFTVGDYNNDGKDDIATMYDYNNGTMKIHAFTSTGTTFNNWQAWNTQSASGTYYPLRTSGFVAGDINGDGKDDIISKYNYAKGYTHLLYFRSTGAAFANWQKITA